MHWIRQCARVAGLRVALTLSLIAAGSVSGLETPDSEGGDDWAFSLRFWPDEVELSGAIRDQRTVDALVAEIRRARPRTGIWDVDLQVDAGAVPIPPVAELAGLLLELALSTKEGSLRITGDSITVSGITDSLVTHSAFETRLKGLIGNRAIDLRNEIRIVSSADFKLPSERRPNLVLDPQPLIVRPVDISDELYGPPAESPDAIAIAIEIVETADLASGLDDGSSARAAFDSDGAATSGRKVPGDPDVAFGPLAPVRFRANSFLIGFEQHDDVGQIARTIKALPPATGKVTLLGFPDGSGQSTYHQWLALARAKQVRRLLVDFGVPEDRLAIEAGKAASLRQVQIVIPGN